MKKLVLMAILAAMPSSAFASILGSKLTMDGVEDLLDDESVGMAVDFNNDNVLNVGDIIFGIVRIDGQSDGIAIGPQRISALYSFEVNSVNAATGLVTFGAIGSSAGANMNDVEAGNGSLFSGLQRSAFKLQTLVSGLGHATGILADWTNAGFAIISNDGSHSDPLAANLAGDLNGYTIVTTHMSAANGWQLELVSGFETPDDYHHVKVSDATIANLENLRAQVSKGDFADFAGGFSVMYHPFGNSEFIPVAGLTADGNFSGTYHDMTIEAGSLSGVKGSGAGADTAARREWMFVDDATFRLNVVPEPTSMITFLGVAACGAFGIRRRNSRS